MILGETMTNQNEEPIAQWAVVELFGHKTIAGCITKETSLFPLLRIDVPATSDYPAYTVEYGPGAIYGITYVSEAVARATAETLHVAPIAVYGPELVTREKFEKIVDAYEQRIAKLRALPEGKANLRPFEQEGWNEEHEEEDEEEV
jgi:hypothetical protein